MDFELQENSSTPSGKPPVPLSNKLPVAFPWSRIRMIAFVGLLLRLATLQYFGPGRVTFGDTADYLDSAKEICTHRDYPSAGASVPFFRPPLLPVFIAVVSDCHPERVSLIKYALSVLDAGTIIILAAMSFTLFGTGAAILTAIAAALYPPFLFQICEIASEPLFLFLQSLFMLLSLKALLRPASAKIALGIGFIGALAALCRPLALVFPILLAIILPLVGPGSRRHGFLRGILIVGAFFLTLSPWIAFNYKKYSEIILVNDAAGYNLWRGNTPEMREIYEKGTKSTFATLSNRFEELSKSRTLEIQRLAKTPKTRERLWFNEALNDFRSSPSEALKFGLYKAFIFWRPWPNPQTSSTLKMMFGLLIVGTLYLLALIGFCRSFRLFRPGLMLVAVGYLVLCCILNVPFQVVTRFRVPLADPLLIVFSSRFAWGKFYSYFESGEGL